MFETEWLDDPFEAAERAAEDWAFENMRGDEVKCPGCGEWVPIEETSPSGPSPYSLPICRKCERK